MADYWHWTALTVLMELSCWETVEPNESDYFVTHALSESEIRLFPLFYVVESETSGFESGNFKLS